MALLTDCDLSGAVGDLFLICEMDGIRVPFLLVSYRPKSPALAWVQLEGIDDDEQAKAFNGKAACLLHDAAVFLPDDDDLEDNDCLHPDGNRRWKRFIGYTVTDVRFGLIGQVTCVDESSINILLQIEKEDDESLVPAALVTTIDREHRAMEVALPDGFLEISAKKR
jgi:16S rRNA processing protein RimM